MEMDEENIVIQSKLRTKKPRVNNQHYVPQSYLSRFCDENGSLHVFNKSDFKSFSTGVRNVANERGYFDVDWADRKAQADGVATQVMEEFFTIEENLFAPLVEALLARLRGGDNRGVSPIEKAGIVRYMAIQAVRTPAFRQQLIQFEVALARSVLAPHSPVLDLSNIDIGIDNETSVHFKKIMFDDFATEILRVFMCLRMTLHRARKGCTFWTSDNPVAMRMPGILMRGNTVAFPIASDYLVALHDPRTENSWCKVGAMSEAPRRAVDQFNTLQVRSSQRHLYAREAAFDLAKRLCQTNPELRDPNRIRSDVKMIDNKIIYRPK